MLVGSATAAVAVFPVMIFQRLATLSWDNPGFDKYRVLAGRPPSR